MPEANPVNRPELICPAGTPAALRAAVDAGADAVYCGLQNATNARNFPGLNFSLPDLQESIDYAHRHKAKVLLAVNTFPRAGQFGLWRDAVDAAAQLGMDAIIVADFGVAAYAARHHPGLRLHLSVQAGASSRDAIRYFCEEFGIRRVVLPRILTVSEIAEIHGQAPCEIETFIFGNIGMMAEGRCSLTNYATGLSTNMDGVCSPAADVRYEPDAEGNMTSHLGCFMIDRSARGESTGYPTICKGRYLCAARTQGYYAFEEPLTLNLSALLPDLIRAGVSAFKIEGRQRSRAYVTNVVSAFRKAVDDVLAGRNLETANLRALSEGGKESQGAYRSKTWR